MVPIAWRNAARLELTLRPVSDQDWTFLAILYASTREQEVAQTGWPVEMQRAFLLQQHEAQNRHHAIAYPQAQRTIIECQAKAVGRLYWSEHERALHIVDIALLPEFRRHGFGAAILADLIDHAAGHGLAITMHVAKDNPARSLYERMGFEQVEDRGLYDLLRAKPPHAA